MASGYITLPLETALFPTALAGTLVKTTSSGTPPSNAGTLTYNTINFTNDSNDERCMWSFTVPPNYLSTPTVTLLWGHTATSGNAVILAGLGLSVTGTTDADASAYLIADTSGAIAVPATAGIDKSTTISLTDRGAAGTLAAGQVVNLFVGRDASADTAAGTLKIRGGYFTFTC